MDDQKQIILRGEHVTAIRKLRPTGNVNFLIIPNKHVVNFTEPGTAHYAQHIVEMAQHLAATRKDQKSSGGWVLKVNSGKSVGQSVFHLHAHIASTEPSW